MAFPIRVGPTTLATGSATTVFTATKDQRITGMYFSDRSGSAKTATIHIVSAASSAASGNKFLDALPVPANDLVDKAPLSIPMKIGETIQGLATGGAGVMFTAEISDEKGTTWR